MNIDNIEELLVIGKRIDTAEDQASDRQREINRDRWQFGRIMLAKRVGKKLPNGYLDELATQTGKGQSELKYRVQFASEGEDALARALADGMSWTQIKKSLSQSTTQQRRSKRDAEIAALKGQGKTRQEISDEVGLGSTAVDSSLRANRAAEEARAELQAETTDWSALPGPQREKLEKAKASITRRLEKEFRARLLAELDQRQAKFDADLADHKARVDAMAKYHQTQRDEERRHYQTVIEINRAKGLITPSEYDLIRSCLHPDSRLSVTDEKLANAFRVFNDSRIKTLLVKEK